MFKQLFALLLVVALVAAQAQPENTPAPHAEPITEGAGKAALTQVQAACVDACSKIYGIRGFVPVLERNHCFDNECAPSRTLLQDMLVRIAVGLGHE